MAHFKQADPDPEKAARDGVANYIPSRSQINTSHECDDCDKTATWELTADGVKLHSCEGHRRAYATTARTYTEKRVR